MRLQLYQVDAFATRPFKGNPAAVAVHDEPLSGAMMQAVATEMNLSETAFVVRTGSSFGLRWFTPVAEVDLCGHATLASAHVLWERDFVDVTSKISFDTRSGRLETWRSDARIEMDFPSETPTMVEEKDAIGKAVGIEPDAVGRNRMDYLAVLGSEEDVRALQPDMNLVVRLGSRGLIVTAPSESLGYDFVSRYFAPQFGIPEDPVTGSAHCCLGPYWSERLGKNELTGYQASARGGAVHVEIRGDRVVIGGSAITVARIEMLATAD